MKKFIYISIISFILLFLLQLMPNFEAKETISYVLSMLFICTLVGLIFASIKENKKQKPKRMTLDEIEESLNKINDDVDVIGEKIKED